MKKNDKCLICRKQIWNKKLKSKYCVECAEMLQELKVRINRQTSEFRKKYPDMETICKVGIRKKDDSLKQYMMEQD